MITIMTTVTKYYPYYYYYYYYSYFAVWGSESGFGKAESMRLGCRARGPGVQVFRCLRV